MTIAERAEQLAARVAAVLDPEMRVRYVRHELSRMEPADIAKLVMIAAGRTETREPPHPELMLAIALALDDPAVAPLRHAAARAAAERGQFQVVQLLGQATTDRVSQPAQVPKDHGGRPLTLGERKALARKNDRELIMRALRDPHQDVITILLGNPAVTEDDVVRLCARRPIDPEVVRSVFRATRWIIRYRVRRAMVLNPHTPRDIALQLAAHLTVQDARLVSTSPELDEELREACTPTRTNVVH